MLVFITQHSTNPHNLTSWISAVRTNASSKVSHSGVKYGTLNSGCVNRLVGYHKMCSFVKPFMYCAQPSKNVVKQMLQIQKSAFTCVMNALFIALII